MARGLLEIDESALDSVAVIAYNLSQPWYNSQVQDRADFYGVTETPTTFLDGAFLHMNTSQTTCYPILRAHFDQRKTVPSPLDVAVSASYDSFARQGVATIKLSNPGPEPVNGQLQLAVCEKHIAWITLDSLPTVFRALLPDAGGEPVTIPAHDSLTRTRDFLIDPTWNQANIEFIAFVQDTADREILQGGRCALIPEPSLRYLGYHSVQPEPGQDCDLVLDVRNVGSGTARQVSATLSSNDPEVQVLAATAGFGDIERASTRSSLTPFRFHVRSDVPARHLVRFELRISHDGSVDDTASFPMLITDQFGFRDDIESQDSGWTHFGNNDQWRVTAHRSASPDHSWYCGNDSAWAYRNDIDAHLVSPYFAVGDGPNLTVAEYYRVEPEYDYCITELNNGSGFWQQLAIKEGTNSSWQTASYDLSRYAGQTVRLGFRFVSDSLVTDEGWYIDDIRVGTPTALHEDRLTAGSWLRVSPLTVGSAEIRYNLPSGATARLEIVDPAGRRIATPATGLRGSGTVIWSLGRIPRPASGVYFARLVSSGGAAVARLLVTD